MSERHQSARLQVSSQLSSELETAAAAFVQSLPDRRADRACFPFDSGARRDWHYIPRRRPGLSLREMNEAQREQAHALLRAALSQAGYDKALAIMDLETVLQRLEPGEPYDPLDYAFAVFGEPQRLRPWGWSVEGHHLSLHFTVIGDRRITVTPFFMGAAPAVVRGGDHDGEAVLADEQDLARQIVRALDAPERDQAMISDRSMGDIVSGPGREESLRRPVGLPLGRLSDARRNAVLNLVEVYARRLRPELADEELARLREAGVENIHFAWAGGLDPGQPHYYRIHGPSLIIEYDNTQEQANHIHTVWHAPGLDFGGDELRTHYQLGHT